MSERIVALEATETFRFTSRDPTDDNQPAAVASLAVDIYEDDSDTQITAADTVEASDDSVVGFNRVAVAATAANGFEAGKRYYGVISAGTVAAGAISLVGEIVLGFRIETTAEMVERLYREKMYQAALVVEATGNTTSRVNLTDLVDAQTADGDLIGSTWDYFRAATNQWQRFVVVSVQSARLFNVVVEADGTALDNAVAANDFLFFAGWGSLRATVPGAKLDVASGIASADVKKIVAVTLTGDGDGTPFDVA